MQSIIHTCEPRQDIIQGSFNPEIFTASISQVASAYSGKGSAIDSIYTDAEAFFREATFPTEGLRRVVRDVMGRLNGDNSKPAIHRLETAFGGGKTHTLIALTHLSYRGQDIASSATDVVDPELLQPAGSIDVVAVACDEMPVIAPSGEKVLAYTLWGEIALRLCGEAFYKDNLKEVTSSAFPGQYFLERMFEGRKVLIMLDELAQYATRYEAAHVGGGEQISAFLMALLGYARTHSAVSVVLTLASQSDAFQGQTGMLQGVLSSTLGRDVDEEEAAACKSRQQQIHQVVDDFFKRLSSTTNLADHISEFNKQIDLSGQDDYEDRKSRLNAADKLPVKISVTTEIYRRNPDVVVEVLLRAKGVCERCKENAPFIRAKDGTPYLEVHHIVQLALGGEDTVENAIALCPNCHREAHFG